ncbi:MAG: hypothetical protein ACYDFU_04765, partial [Nitrospirota bacterium]
PNAYDLSGWVAALKDEKKDGTQGDILYIDRGAADGVLPGDKFVVGRSGGSVKKGCPLKKGTQLPGVNVGLIQVISVRERTAAAKVLKTDEPLQAGYGIYYSRPQ